MSSQLNYSRVVKYIVSRTPKIPVTIQFDILVQHDYTQTRLDTFLTQLRQLVNEKDSHRNDVLIHISNQIAGYLTLTSETFLSKALLIIDTIAVADSTPINFIASACLFMVLDKVLNNISHNSMYATLVVHERLGYVCTSLEKAIGSNSDKQIVNIGMHSYTGI
jgi:hypothetical protein